MPSLYDAPRDAGACEPCAPTRPMEAQADILVDMTDRANDMLRVVNNTLFYGEPMNKLEPAEARGALASSKIPSIQDKLETVISNMEDVLRTLDNTIGRLKK